MWRSTLVRERHNCSDAIAFWTNQERSYRVQWQTAYMELIKANRAIRRLKGRILRLQGKPVPCLECGSVKHREHEAAEFVNFVNRVRSKDG